MAGADGRDVAIVSDAGTPGISDPGERIVRAVIDAGYDVSAVPGPSAAIMALTISGLDTAAADDRLVFTNIDRPNTNAATTAIGGQEFRDDAVITLTTTASLPSTSPR